MAGIQNDPNARKVDFSAKATSRAVLKETLQHPLTLYSSAVGLLGGLAMTLFDVSLLTSGVAVGGVGIAAGAWAINYFFRGDAFVSRHVAQMQADLAAQKNELSRRLAADLGGIKPVKGAEDLATQARQQFPMIKEKFDVFDALLQEKLAPTELTYARYLGTAEQIYLSVLDNLVLIVSAFKSISSIDRAYVDGRLAAVAALKNPEPADLDEAETLKKRLALLDEQIHKINALATLNEEAMTAMDVAAAAVADMKTQKGRATTSLPTAIKDLEELANRARQYSIDRP